MLACSGYHGVCSSGWRELALRTVEFPAVADFECTTALVEAAKPLARRLTLA